MKLTRFDYGKCPVRATNIKGEVWFVASDLCATLGIDNNRRATSRLDPDEKGVHSMNTPGGVQKVIMVNESGLYHLVFTSRKEEAKTFRRWVTMEVLPQIRKTGAYSVKQQELPLKGVGNTDTLDQKGGKKIPLPEAQGAHIVYPPPLMPKMEFQEALDLLVNYVCPHLCYVDDRLGSMEKAMRMEPLETYKEFRKRTC